MYENTYYISQYCLQETQVVNKDVTENRSKQHNILVL